MNLKKIFESILNEGSIDTTDFKLVRELGGSTGAQLFQDGTGKKWVVKAGNHIDHMYNEYLSNKLYEKFGIKVPKSFLGEVNGVPCFIAEYLEGSIPLGDNLNDKIKTKAAKGFIFDALFANYDVVGSDEALDNMRIWNGEVHRVDVGASLIYRGQGRDKEFGEEPEELDSLRSWKNHTAARVFSKVSEDGLQKQVNQIMKKFVVEDDISWEKYQDWLSKVVNQDEIKLSPEKKQEILMKLLIRTKNIYKRFN